MTLIEKLKAADGPDRELDAEIWAYQHGGSVCEQEYVNPETQERFFLKTGLKDRNGVHRPGSPLPFTSSLDAVLGLIGEVLPGWRWAVSEGARASLQRGPAALSRGSIPITAKHKSPAIALLIALLKASNND